MTLAATRSAPGHALRPTALGSAWRAVADIARRWSRRQWLAVAAGGAAYGVAQTLYSLHPLPGIALASQIGIVLVLATGWIVKMTAWACLLLVGLGALQRREGEQARVPAWRYLLVIASVVLGALLLEPLCVFFYKAGFAWFGPNPYASWFARPWLPTLKFMSAASLPQALTLASMGVLIHLYNRRARRTIRALSSAQIDLAETQRRMLAEALQSAQASVDPRFLFATLNRIGTHFTSDAPRAERLLEALIRYLRAALPARGESGCTLGQQAELLRAWIEIESLCAGDRLRARIELPAALAARALAPLLVMPLAANALRHGIEPERDGEIALHAWVGGGRLVIDIEDDGAGRVAGIREGAGLMAVRQRLDAIHGANARLTLMDREPRGIRARLEFNHDGEGDRT